MNDKTPTEVKSKQTKQSSTRKKLVKVKKLKNTNDMTGTVGGVASFGGGVDDYKGSHKASVAK